MGGLIVLGNVYMGLKAGVVVGGSLVAALLSFVVFRALRLSFTPLKNNMAQTVGSASGTLGNVWDVLPALVLLGTPLTMPQAMVWCFSVSLLGVFFAIPLRHQLIEIEKLPFPDGTACAETIRSLHEEDRVARSKTGVLGLTGTLAAGFAFLKEGLPQLAGSLAEVAGGLSARIGGILSRIHVPDRIFPFDLLGPVIRGHRSSELYLGFTTSPMFLAIGLLVGPRIGLSMLLGAVVSWGLIAPWLLQQGVIEAVKYRQTVSWTMWAGTALMVSAGLTSLIKHAPSLVRAFRRMTRASSTFKDGRGAVEVPFQLWLGGILVAAALVLTVLRIQFGVPVWAGVAAVALSFVLAIVATRAAGETNNNPVGAVGHVTQGVFSGIGSFGAIQNVMAGGVAAAGASQATDIMQDLKTGHLLGATPRRQFWAQLVGVAVGTCVAVPAFFLLWRVYGLGPESEVLPAPAGISWSNFARVLSEGWTALPPHAPGAVLLASLLGVALALPPQRIQRHLPSAFGLGIAFIYPGMYALTICLGSLLGPVLRKSSPDFMQRNGFILASGLIVGEAVMGTLVAAWILTSDLLPRPLVLLLPLLLLGSMLFLAALSWRQLRGARKR
jgi:uncharacterized oligopeptide transporter (OPT) family protein